jgi:hypothetical protein
MSRRNDRVDLTRGARRRATTRSTATVSPRRSSFHLPRRRTMLNAPRNVYSHGESDREHELPDGDPLAHP